MNQQGQQILQELATFFKIVDVDALPEEAVRSAWTDCNYFGFLKVGARRTVPC
jgi:hypothetical protein